ncbi:hypothetical protein TWF694_001025 [Orbilia ellipsospora]|uniref:Methyltransferase domain-containing protein n=1 Tax=Orbilia ellipsospora TaxID=2528407 RepID=A0AAV9XQG5_9PEZI
MSVQANGTYVLDSSQTPEPEKARLNIQHRVFVENLGFLLPPSILGPSGSENLVIADIATGTGIWIEELSKSLPPSCVLHGYDITDRQFPNPANIPPNLKFSLLDIFEPIPEALYEKYDIVHIRLLCMVLKVNEWYNVIANIRKLIKPGGYLVWTDGNPGSVRPHPPTPIAAQAGKAQGYLCKLRGGDPFCARNIPRHFTNNKLRLISPSDPPSSSFCGFYTQIIGESFKESTLAPSTKQAASSLRGMVEHMSENNIENEWFTSKTVEEFLENLSDEVRPDGGSHLVFDFVCVVGKKEDV